MYEQTKGHHIKRYMLQDLELVVNDNQKQNSSMSSHIAGRKKKNGRAVVWTDTERSSCSSIFLIWGNLIIDLYSSEQWQSTSGLSLDPHNMP